MPIACDKRKYRTNDNVEISYRSWPGGSRGTILFIHGLGADGRQFAQDAVFFAALGYRVVVVDLRGHGLSTLPHPLTRENLTVQKMAEDLLPLMDGLADEPIHLVGNSMGGLVALALICMRGDQIASLTTFGTTYRLRFPPGIPTLQYVVGRLLGKNRLAKAVAKNATNHDHVRPLLQDMYDALNLRLMYLIQQNIRVYDYLDVAAAYSGPVLILRGEQDKDINKYIPSTLDTLENNPRFRLVEICDAGHFTNLDQPTEFRSKLVNFLEANR